MKVTRDGRGFRVTLDRAAGTVCCSSAAEVAKVVAHYYASEPGHADARCLTCPLCCRMVEKEAKRLGVPRITMDGLTPRV